VPNIDASAMLTHLMLGVAAMGWSGAYGMFAVIYGRFLVCPTQE